MNYKKLAVLLLSAAYIFCLSAIFTADLYYRRSLAAKDRKISPTKALGYINKAIFLNPVRSTYRYQKYYLLKMFYANRKAKSACHLSQTAKQNLLSKGIQNLEKAIELEPTKPSYHLFYALSLIKRDLLRGKEIPKIARQELRRAVELKPYSELYQQIYNQRLSSI
ncbi:MAG: hypothetical protein KAS87_04925 [Candidatus Omnitrophica bacterium]|nr:hypothetical protein [Candidatus Omnitrophota bacterium]